MKLTQGAIKLIPRVSFSFRRFYTTLSMSNDCRLDFEVAPLGRLMDLERRAGIA